ncbi:MAG: hypothetical protein HC838_09135 [Spirulinaceae cyanobacterium RM2_2_10]|nr:hypothetical protein [Spirulinaceae cyanobacterium SM2_1_0]NJO20182.1 hypothetical protein [Spirulinaceae cyanobacterium RM2_2_10]
MGTIHTRTIQGLDYFYWCPPTRRRATKLGESAGVTYRIGRQPKGGYLPYYFWRGDIQLDDYIAAYLKWLHAAWQLHPDLAIRMRQGKVGLRSCQGEYDCRSPEARELRQRLREEVADIYYSAELIASSLERARQCRQQAEQLRQQAAAQQALAGVGQRSPIVMQPRSLMEQSKASAAAAAALEGEILKIVAYLLRFCPPAARSAFRGELATAIWQNPPGA